MAVRTDHDLARLAAEIVPATMSDDLHSRFAGLPSMIMTSGLAATGAFLLARAKSGQEAQPNGTRPEWTVAKALLQDAASFARIPVVADDPERTLDQVAREQDGHRRLLAETRARMFAVWLARIAAARRVRPQPAGTPATDTTAGTGAR